MKAFVCSQDYEPCSTVVFAETASKARYIAMTSGTLGDDLEFRDVTVRRVPELDHCYDGRKEMDWCNPNDRLALVRDGGFYCSDDAFDADDCERCSGREYCDRYSEYLEECEEDGPDI